MCEHGPLSLNRETLVAATDSTDAIDRRVEIPPTPDFNNTPETLRAIFDVQVKQAVAVNNISEKIRRVDIKLNTQKALEARVEANKAEIDKHKPIINVMRWAGKISGASLLVWWISKYFD